MGSPSHHGFHYYKGPMTWGTTKTLETSTCQSCTKHPFLRKNQEHPRTKSLKPTEYPILVESPVNIGCIRHGRIILKISKRGNFCQGFTVLLAYVILPVEKAFFEGTNWNGSGLGVGRHKDVKGKKYYYCILLLLYSSHFFLLLNFDALERSRLNKCIVAGLRRSDRK